MKNLMLSAVFLISTFTANVFADIHCIGVKNGKSTGLAFSINIIEEKPTGTMSTEINGDLYGVFPIDSGSLILPFKKGYHHIEMTRIGRSKRIVLSGKVGSGTNQGVANQFKLNISNNIDLMNNGIGNKFYGNFGLDHIVFPVQCFGYK